MIKLVYAFRRLPNLSMEECQNYWLTTHGELVRRHAAALRAVRYVQVHTIDDPLNEVLQAGRGEIKPYDGIANLWWESREAFEQSLSTPEGQKAAEELVQDERRFVDHLRSSLWLAKEYSFIDRMSGTVPAGKDGAIVKLSFVFRRLPGMSLEQCQTYWRDVHGQRVLQQIAHFPLRRYIQSHTLDDPLNDVLCASRGAEEPYDGVAETWGVLEELAEAAATPEGQQAAEDFLADERNFIDPVRSSIWLSKEHIIFE